MRRKDQHCCIIWSGSLGDIFEQRWFQTGTIRLTNNSLLSSSSSSESEDSEGARSESCPHHRGSTSRTRQMFSRVAFRNRFRFVRASSNRRFCSTLPPVQPSPLMDSSSRSATSSRPGMTECAVTMSSGVKFRRVTENTEQPCVIRNETRVGGANSAA
jgi:hypothetical protein